jgi:hypothetical protein
MYAVLGTGVGALAAWAVTADIYEKRIKEERAELQELLEDKTDHIFALKDRVSRLENMLEEAYPSEPSTLTHKVIPNPWAVELPFTEEPPEEAISEPEEQVVPEGETTEETRNKLQSLIDQYTSDEAVQESFVRQVAQSEVFDQKPPFVISREEFAYGEDTDEYDKLTLTYFPRHRVLLDDDDEVMENIVQLVGWKNLNQFGGESGDPDTVFIRNPKLMTDFEVVKNDEADLPLHVQYGMEKEEFRANKAAGTLKLRQEDE